MRFIGIDIGEVSFKAVWLDAEKETKQIFRKNHGGEIAKIWKELKEKWGICATDLVVTTGVSRNVLPFPSVPEMVAQKKALHFLYPEKAITLIRLAGGGFSVLKNQNGKSEYRRHPECASGTGAFLDQNLNRFGLTISEADPILTGVESLKFSGRCAVFLKTEATHAVNAGGQKEKAIAGLFDATARNAVALAEKSALTKKTLLIGGLSSSRRIAQTIQQELPETKVEVPAQALYWEALGAALIATERNLPKVKAAAEEIPLVFLPPLKDYLGRVTKITDSGIVTSNMESLVLGLDIGSTGSKAAIVSKQLIYEDYCETKGDPVLAAQTLISRLPKFLLENIKAVGVTGSGREIVGPLLTSLFGEQVFVLNEIAAHARGAVFYNPKVDTIIDIGGQDAKFALLQNGVLIDSAMNTVCSAGTGSFLAEQLQLLGISDVKKMGEIALESPQAVDLGEHCAVFIAKQIGKARQKDATLPEIVAGLYDSISRNYDHRVKGSRRYGKKIFLQGKPAENIVLALALSKVSDQPIIVPPSPGIMGALGIALLAKQEIKDLENFHNLNLERFLASKVIDVSQFVCQSKDGCEKGNQCKVKVLEVELEGKNFKFFWDDRCGKHQKTKKSTVLARAPQPFLERERLISKLIIKDFPFSTKTVGIPRGLETEDILVLVITFFQQLGLRVKLHEASGLKTLEQGTKICQSDFCAPLQLLAGEAKELEGQDFIFLPKVIEIEGRKQEDRCYVCPLSQAMPDMFKPKLSGKILTPFLNLKEGYEKNLKEFLLMGLKLGTWPWESYLAFKKAIRAQKEFKERLFSFGLETLEFGKNHNIPVVVVFGNDYIIHSQLLNSGVPEIILEKGALALPSDCYPLKGLAPKLNSIYWGYGHRFLAIAYEVRRQPGVFSLLLSPYSCGPASFLTHFFQYLSTGKPYCLLETDAHTGRAGFGTRIEAFLYGVGNYKQPANEQNLSDLSKFESKGEVLSAGEKRKVLIPWMGESSMLAPALLKTSLDISAEYLPNDEEALEMGRKVTSGKECLPMIVTIGSLLKWLKNHPRKEAVFFMPSANGPCRFGQYHILTQIILEGLGLDKWVKVISPNSETGYFLNKQFGPAMRAKTWSTFVFVDMLKDALLQIRPVEKIAGETDNLFSHILKLAETNVMISPNDWLGFKNLWGFTELAKLAVLAFKKIPVDEELKHRLLPVLVTGEVFVRHDEFSNQRIIRQLEALGVQTKLAGLREWFNYTLFQRRKGMTVIKTPGWKLYLTWLIQKTIEERLYRIFAKGFGWPKNHSIDAILKMAKPHLSRLRPQGEAGLTIGLPLLLWRKKEIKGAVILGPFECMPTRTAEEILMMASEKNGLPVLNVSFHGDQIDRDTLESFVWNLKSR